MRFFLCFLIPIVYLCAAERATFAAPSNLLSCEQFTIEDGMGSNFAVQLLQDSQGFMWIATEQGLCKFDGYEFTVYQHKPEDLKSLRSSSLFSILEDRNGIIWIGTYRGVHSLNPNTGEIVIYDPQSNDLQTQRGNRITFLEEDDDGTVWAGTRSAGLRGYNPKNGLPYSIQKSVNNNRAFRSDFLYCAAKEPGGTFLISPQGGHLDRFDPKYLDITHLTDQSTPTIGQSDVISLKVDREGVAWLGTWESGLIRFDPQTGAVRQWLHDPADPNSLGGNIVRSLYWDRSGILWIGLNNGVVDTFDPATETFRHCQLLPKGQKPASKIIVMDILQDASKAFWFATLDHGVLRYDPQAAWFGLRQSDPLDPTGLSSNLIFALCADRNGYIWIGTDGGGVNRYNPRAETYKVYRKDSNEERGLLGDTVVSLLEDRNGYIWIGYTINAFSRFDPQSETFRHFRESPDGLHGNSIRALCEDAEGFIWIGTDNCGVNRFDPTAETFTYYPSDSSKQKTISDKYISTIYRDVRNALWFGTMGFGLNRFDPMNDGFTVFAFDATSLTGLSGSMVCAIQNDALDRLWVGTNTGLNLFDPKTNTFERYTMSDGLPNNTIKSIVRDDRGVLWIATERGLSRFNVTTKRFQNFDLSDRLQNLSFNIGCACKAPSGEMYFGGKNGFNRFHPDDIAENHYVPPILITSFKVMGESIDWERQLKANGRIVLPYNRNFLQFEFTALNYTRSYRNQYRFYLAGLDEDPIEATQRRYVQYTSLRPGNYEFHVTASNNDNVWNEEGVSIPIVITPPFWERLWFRLLAVLCMTAAVALFYEKRMRAIQRRKIELQNEVERQTQRVVEQSLELERINQELEKLSFLDGLTNIPNRRCFEKRLDHEWKRAKRNRECISLIMLDIDFFKKFNDAYGHQAGDECLRRTAKVLENNAKRPYDLSARYGGEEFVVLLPETDRKNAENIAENIRSQVEDLQIPHERSDAGKFVTLSLGGATVFPQNDNSASDLIRSADDALYRAKDEGRNRTVWTPAIECENSER